MVEHLELVKSKAWKRINTMRKLKFQLDRKSLQTTCIYFSCIRPLLEYGDVVWNNCTQYEANELDRIQNEAASIVAGATKLASIDSLHTETGWKALGSRRKTHKLTMFYKTNNGVCTDYLSSRVPATVDSASTYHLHYSSDLQTLHTNSRLYYTSFLPSAVRDWNELPEQTRNSPYLSIFKNRLKTNLFTRAHPAISHCSHFLLKCRVATNVSHWLK